MINALYEPFPDRVSADGAELRILTDHREWLRFGDLLADSEVPDRDRIVLMTRWLLDVPERITAELIAALLSFYRADALEPERQAAVDDEDDRPLRSPPVLDWSIDAPYIIGDFQHYYGIDLLSETMHWWRFRLLFKALPQGSQMIERIGYRSVDLGQVRSEAERSRIMKMKQLYALPFELDDEDIGAVFGGAI